VGARDHDGAVNVLRHRTVAFLLALVAAAAGWEAFIRLTAPGKLDPVLTAALVREQYVNIAVQLPFAPEDFHVRLFQGHGVVSGVRGTTVLLNRVRPDDVWQIARYYWVRRIAPQGGSAAATGRPAAFSCRAAVACQSATAHVIVTRPPTGECWLSIEHLGRSRFRHSG
jgi:hypothetical protein